jgi:hypothetical protein
MNELIRPQFHDAEISKATDFGGTSEFPVELINILFDGIYREVSSNFVLGGLDVLEVTPLSMNVKVTPGVAYDRASKKALVLSNDLIVSVASCDPNLDRIDTVEIKYVEVDVDVEMRTFKDPANGTVASQSIPTKKKITVQGKCLAGVPGSGVAPDVEEGWVKLAEVSVLAGTGSITGDDIREMDSEFSTVANSGWTAQVSSTFRVGSPYWIKRIARLHENTLITNASMAHGIRQGRGNGFDTDKVRGVTPTDNGLHLLSLEQYDLGWDSMLYVSPTVYTSKLTWQPDYPYMKNEQTFYEGVPYRSRTDLNIGHIPPNTLGQYWEKVGGGDVAGSDPGYTLINGNFEAGVSDWTGYKDAAQSTPEDGVGGTVSSGHTFTFNQSAPLVGGGDALWTKPAAVCMGEGFSAPFTIDEGVRKQDAQISFYFKILSENYIGGDYGVYIIDATNGGIIPGSQSLITRVINQSTQMVINFTPSNSKNYRLCFHVRTDNDSPMNVRIDNITIGARKIMQGAVITDPVDYVPVVTGLGSGTLSFNSASWRRVGSFIEVIGRLIVSSTAGTGSTSVNISLPQIGITIGRSGEYGLWASVTSDSAGALTRMHGNFTCSADSSVLSFRTYNTSTGNVNALVGSDLIAGKNIGYQFMIPIAQWAGSGTVGTVQNYVEYASNSDVTATASVTGSGFLQGFGNFGGFGSGWAVGTTWVRRVKFQQPIQWGMDEILIGLTLPTNGSIWDHAEYSSYMIAASAFGNQTIGFKVDPVAGDPYSADVSFFAGGRKSSGAYGSVGSPWSDLTLFKWFAKKTSAGKPGETLPLIRAEYTMASTLVPSAANTVIPLTTKVIDSHSCVSGNNFIVPISGYYLCETTIGGNTVTTSSCLTTTQITVGGSGVRLLSQIMSPAGTRLFGGGAKSLYLNAGEVLAFGVYTEGNTGGNITSARCAVTLIGR